MTVTVLGRTWEVEIWPARPAEAPNAVYLQIRHKPAHGGPSLLPSGLRFGLTEAEVHRLAHGLIAATSPDPGHATEAIRSFRTDTEKADRSSTPACALKTQFTKTQGRYLAFIHRYIEKFGQAPAEADIQRHFLVSAPSVNAMMQTLTRKRFISRVPGVPRSIKLLVPPQVLPKD